MNKKITITFTETKNTVKDGQKIQEIIAGGFYSYLKKNGYLRQNPEKQQKIQQALEESRKICHGMNSLDLA
jgi:hypothetical protein